LAKIGILKPQKELIAALRGASGDVYQYIGSAQASKTAKSAKLPQFSPNTKSVHDENYESIIDDCRRQIADLQAELNATREQLDSTPSRAAGETDSIVGQTLKKILRKK